MRRAELPGGGHAWFVRRGTFWCYQVTPVTLGGWVLTGAYAAAAIALSLFIFADQEHPGLEDWIVWAVPLASMTVLFIVTVFRLSARAPVAKKGRHRCS